MIVLFFNFVYLFCLFIYFVVYLLGVFVLYIYFIIQHIRSRRNCSGRHSLRKLVEHGQGRCCGTGVLHSRDKEMEAGKATPF